MTRKGEAHKTLSLLFHCDGVPPTMVFDGSKVNVKDTLRENFARLIATQDRMDPTPHGSRPLKVVSVS
jgi:hypothetical protein